MMLRFCVMGQPVPQGSKKAFARIGRNGRPFATIVDDNKSGLKSWRNGIANECRLAMMKAEKDPGGYRAAFDGQPIVLVADFLFARPKSVTREHMTVTPDADKLLRAVLDALTDLAFKDDAQVVTPLPIKRYLPPGQAPSRLYVSLWVGGPETIHEHIRKATTPWAD